MCIRDREYGENVPAPPATTPDNEEDEETGIELAPGRLLEAVSYTHLRAHETVLDLVCRLLLDKKKLGEAVYHGTAPYENVGLGLHH